MGKKHPRGYRCHGCSFGQPGSLAGTLSAGSQGRGSDGDLPSLSLISDIEAVVLED